LRGMNRSISSIEVELGALGESLYTRFAWEDIRLEVESSGERLVSRVRNARVDGEDIDLLIVTDKSLYVVEVKVKPKQHDVGALLAKAEVAAKHYPGKRVVPVLAGALIGREVEDYARGKGVLVYTY